VPKLSNVFPPIHPDEAETHPVASASISNAATFTKVYTNPTAALPDNHTEHEGEAEHPAFPVKPIPSASASASSSAASATSTVGWVSDTKAFVDDQKYLLGVVAIILVVVIVTGICFQRRLRARRQQARYAALGDGDSLPMRSLDAQGPTHHADDEDADEETGLRAGLGYHDEFLEDEASPRPSQQYKDEPEERPTHLAGTRDNRGSPSDGSGGSWEHAS
jgi:kexin